MHPLTLPLILPVMCHLFFVFIFGNLFILTLKMQVFQAYLPKLKADSLA